MIEKFDLKCSLGARVGAGLALVLLFSAGCAGRQHGNLRPGKAASGGCSPVNQQACQELYLLGNSAAMFPRPEDIRTDLLALLPSTPGLVWDDQGRILLSTWTRWEYYEDPQDPTRPKYAPNQTFSLHGDTWFTAVPRVQEVCREIFPSGMDWVDLRLEQLIGLPPFTGKDAFLQVWVEAKEIFRPCPDPEIFDRECQVDVPVVGNGQAPLSPPWAFCADPHQQQTASSFVTIAPESLKWICDNWCTSYCNDTGYPCDCTEPEATDPFPWTALGYSYDWGRPANPQGFSEFVVRGGATVAFEALAYTEEYCAPPDP